MLIYGQVGGLGMPALKVHSIGQSAVRSKNFILRAVFSSYHPPSNRRQARPSREANTTCIWISASSSCPLRSLGATG